MELELKRHTFKPNYTMGKLLVNGKYFCDVIENTVRDLNMDGDLDDSGEGKIYGKTAIPYGRYEVKITMSNRFKKELPLLIGVKGFDGIRIHSGNYADYITFLKKIPIIKKVLITKEHVEVI